MEVFTKSISLGLHISREHGGGMCLPDVVSNVDPNFICGFTMYQKRRKVIWNIWLEKDQEVVKVCKKIVHLMMIPGQIIEILQRNGDEI